MGVQAQARCGEEARATRPQQRNSSTAHLLAPRILAAEAGFRRSAHRQKDLEEAVLVAVEPAGRFDVQERKVQLASNIITARKTDLVDEAGHEMRAELGHVWSRASR